MKFASNRIVLVLICTLLTVATNAQSLVGAWESYTTAENGKRLKNIVVFSDGYQVFTSYDATTGEFIQTNGGAWQLDGETMTETIEFDTADAERVGSKISFKIAFDDSSMGIVGDATKWKRIDKGEPGKLQGAWLMSGRIRDGKTQTRDLNRPRKTMKILSGTRFQWIAYNTETKQFMGTGGGTYTTIDGKYTENIEFFSRDNSRAGVSLEFDFNIKDGKWHHSGHSSKGDPMHEIWSVRK